MDVADEGAKRRYVHVPDGGTLADAMRAEARRSENQSLARRWAHENVCANCGDARDSHLGEAPFKGAPKEDDSGWCALPAGTCISGSCKCAAFVEPSEAEEQAGFAINGSPFEKVSW